MTLRDWNSFYYHSQGWTLASTTRTQGIGQSSIAGLRTTGNTQMSATFGFASMTHILFGFALNAGNIVGTGRFLQVNGSNGASTPHFSLHVGSGGEIIAYRSNGAVELGRTGPGLIANSVTSYIELRVKASTGTAGEVEIRVNGNPTPVLDLSGLHMHDQNADWVNILFQPAGTNSNKDLSAFYFLEVDATTPNDFLGHIRFGVGDPNGDGANSDFVGSDGNSVNNYALVDEGFTASSADYVQSPTVGDTDTYAHPSLPSTALSIIAVCPLVQALKTDAGTRAIRPIIRSGGTEYEGDEQFLGLSYQVYKHAFLQNPDGPADWDETTYDAAEIGLRVST